MSASAGFRSLAAGLLLPLALALGGCATPPRRAFAHYTVDPNRAHGLTAGKAVLVCTAFDRLDDPVRQLLDPAFTVSEYVTGAVELELDAAQVRHRRAAFAFAPGFEGLHGALALGALPATDTVVLACTVNQLIPPNLICCDFRLYSNVGVQLFAKRCTASILLPPAEFSGQELIAPRMMLQQIFADPAFQKALQ